jgi:murein DD-endopeptidase MepM/ murein hydrolase activator NlpD
VIDNSRHATTGRFKALRKRQRSSGLPQVYGGRGRRTIRDIYEVDLAHGGAHRYRWLASTCLAAAVGAIAIGVVLFGSQNRNGETDSLLRQLAIAQEPAPTPLRLSMLQDGLNWAVPKSNRLQLANGALTARYTIHEQVQVRRNNRPFIQIRPYLRISMRLVPASPTNRDVIPNFNPFALYASIREERTAKDNEDAARGRIDARVVELLGGILPGTDDQELDTEEVRSLVRDLRATTAARTDRQPINLDRVGILPGNLTPSYISAGNALVEAPSIADAITTIERRIPTAELNDAALESSEMRVIRVGRQTELNEILSGLEAPAWQTRIMVEAAQSVIGETTLPRGHEVRVRLVPHDNKMEPDAVAIFGPLNQHLVTVRRADDGEFVADANFDPNIFMTRTNFQSAAAADASLYASLYDAALTQSLPPDEIMKILRINAYNVDFRKRVRDGDQLELFYELNQKPDGTTSLGELLYVAITAGGDRHRFWRFRSRDGSIEFYDERGENSKKFLMRKPVRGSNVRLTSGFGYRRHPILKERRMHTGTDWAAPTGTPILAAGRGVIEEAKRKGTYGNYVRIKHANGYQTAYSHMSRFEPGIRPGVKVRQGQVIGYVGTTGLSSGPHLHYEVLVNNRFVDAIKIKVPRARKLAAKELTAFQRERERIEVLMRRSPVQTASR